MQFKSFKSQVSSFNFHEIQISYRVLVLGIGFFALLLTFPHPVWGNVSAPTALLDSANTSYSRGNFQKASEYYEAIISLGYESPEVYFNLGNSYYKLDKIGLSVLNYERSKKNSPQDEDINFNLKLANQRTIDKIEPAPKLFLEEWWGNLKSMHSEKTWGIRSIICFVLFFFFLGIFLLSGKSINKQFGFWLGLIFFIFSVISLSVSKSRYDDITKKNYAVILSSSVEIKNSPSEAGTKLFILHEGTKVFAPETNGEWVKVELSSEKSGWVKKSSVGFI